MMENLFSFEKERKTECTFRLPRLVVVAVITTFIYGVADLNSRVLGHRPPHSQNSTCSFDSSDLTANNLLSTRSLRGEKRFG